VGREDDYQVAAPTEREHPPSTERISLTKECGWKDGDRGGLAEGQELTRKKRRTKTSLQERKKRKTYLTLTGLLMEGVGNALDLDRMALRLHICF
jgi:hypothetical protein